MADPAAVALSLLPVQLWGQAAARGRAGDPPDAVVGEIVAARWPDEPRKRATLLEEAALALARGAARGLQLIEWRDAGYPLPLTVIVDPPPVLWARGCI